MKQISINIHQTTGHIQPELHSQFIEFLGSCIYDGIWVGEHSDIPNDNGLRKDVVDALKELNPPAVRWPGGCYADTYHWRNGIGPREQRPVTYNENFGTYELDSHQFGTHEFMELCKQIGAKPWFNCNLMSGSVEEMRDWMEYCNRPASTTLANERKQNGAPEPFQVELWGIGNEMWGGGGTMTPQDYAQKYRQFATAFPNFYRPVSDSSKANLPNSNLPNSNLPNRNLPENNPSNRNCSVIHSSNESPDSQLHMYRIACGPDGNKPKERIEWTKQFFASMAEFRQPPLDGYDIHFYNWNIDDLTQSEWEFDDQEWYAVIAHCQELEQVILEQKELVQQGLSAFPEAEGPFPVPEKKCDLIVGEWGNWHGSAFTNRPALYQQCSMRDAITSALTLDIFHRNCDSVKMACVAQTVNVLNSLLLTDGNTCIRTPNYDVFSMYKVHQDAEALQPAMETELDPHIYCFASRKQEMIYVNLIHTGIDNTETITLNFDEDLIYLSGEALHSEDIHSFNTAQHPNQVRKKAAETPKQIRSHPSETALTSQYQCALPPASIQVYTFQINHSEANPAS